MSRQRCLSEQQLSQTAAWGRNRLREATGESLLIPESSRAYRQRGYAGRPDRQSSSTSRVTAGAAGFFTLIQFALRPER